MVQIFYNIFGYPDVPVHSVFCQRQERQSVSNWLRSNASGVCRKCISDVELRCNNGENRVY